MHKITGSIKQFYLENPELFEERVFLEMEMLENYLDEFDLISISKDAFNRWQKMWLNAKSYWIFPDQNDMKKLVEELYDI